MAGGYTKEMRAANAAKKLAAQKEAETQGLKQLSPIDLKKIVEAESGSMGGTAYPVSAQPKKQLLRDDEVWHGAMLSFTSILTAKNAATLETSAKLADQYLEIFKKRFGK
jgi:hypothetical protein